MRGIRPAGGRYVELASREDDGPHVPAIHVNSRVGIQVLGVDGNAPAYPFGGNGDLTLVPGTRDAAQIPVLPTRMDVDCLAIFLHIICDSRPAGRDLEVAPLPSGYNVRVLLGRLPEPQTIDAYPLARGC
ncbi:MAG: hypothetical protein ACYSU3_10670 [Planctomycetota bacterium]